MSRVLLIGRDGQVGGELVRSLSVVGTLIAFGREEMDLTDESSIREVVRKIRPDVVVNAAAYTDVDRAESEPERAHRINARAPYVLAQASREVNALLVHFSTDYVFDGEKRRPYHEDDPTRPVNVYGATKLEGEKAIRSVGGDYLILRTSWIYGPRGNNFMCTMIKLAKEREEIRVVDDQVGTPTSSLYAASTTASVIRRWLSSSPGSRTSGTYHMTPRGQTTWYSFARLLLDNVETGISAIPTLIPVTTAEYPRAARRPPFSVLNSGRLEREYGIEPPPFEEEVMRVCAIREASGRSHV